MPARDCDDICAYTYPKTVRIRHKWVGILYFTVVLLVIAYILIFQMYYSRGYARDVPGASPSSSSSP